MPAKRGKSPGSPSLGRETAAARSQTTEEEPSCVSHRSSRSKGEPLNFGVDEKKCSQTTEEEPSCVSHKSSRSKGEPLNFGVDEKECIPSMDQPDSSGVQQLKGSQKRKECSSSSKSDLSTEHTLSAASEKKKKRCHEVPSTASGHTSEKFQHIQGFEDDGEKVLKVIHAHKEAMKKQVTFISEDNNKGIFSELIITIGESEGPHEEHTFRNKKKNEMWELSSINLADIFQSVSSQSGSHRTVLTKGVAGIGKSFTVQKFLLDWTEERANQDIDVIFSLVFRQLNLSTGDKSLRDLLVEFYPDFQDYKTSDLCSKTKIMVILDGLDESRIQLDFGNKVITSISEKTSVGNLLVNLIQGNLLPDAKLWITTRPAAASQIPAEYIHMVTEIRGFRDQQKEEYFRKTFSHDHGLADRIISHVQSSPSLDIMCQIPIFCWICALLFEEIFGEGEEAKTPQTLTEMMSYFLLAQTKRRNRKYEAESASDEEELLKTYKNFILKLGKLAFVHLQKNDLIFYDTDLEAEGIDIKEAAIYSGFYSTIFIEEGIISQRKVYSFVHLTIHEFFAALFVYDCLLNSHKQLELKEFLSLEDKEYAMPYLLKMMVDKVVKKEHGHLDFFLRFCLGLMVESNRKVLRGLLESRESNQETVKKILIYLKALHRKGLSPDCSISLFQAMVEMRDHKVKDEIQDYLKNPSVSQAELTPMQCSALAFMLLVSKDDLEELNLKKYKASDEGRRRLIPAVRTSKKAVLAHCRVTPEWIEHLAFGLKFPYLPLRELDLSNNDLTDLGVEELCKALASETCRLNILRLSGCLVTEKGSSHLASALDANPSHLTELDLSYNHLGDNGSKVMFQRKTDEKYALTKLDVDWGGIQRLKPGLMKYACNLTFDPGTAHKNLCLSEENQKVSWVKEIQSYRNNKERFENFPQVLTSQGLERRCYWEMEVMEPFTIGVAYKTIGREGIEDDCKLGRNDKSWCLTCGDDGYYVWHNNKSVSVSSHSSRSSRVGVYLDTVAGTLSFYRVFSNSQVCLHTFEGSFSDLLYPAVALDTVSSAMFCQPVSSIF